jgi:LynF/TruF/PatF family peptide O-prenyltransferase
MDSMATTSTQNRSEARNPAVAETFEAYVTAFELPENAVLAAFRKLVYEDHHLLEYSVKLDERGVHPARFAMIYDGDMRARIERILEFFKEVIRASSGEIDFSLVAAIVRDLDLNKVQLCACGFDLRPNIDDCRFKFWLRFRDQPYKVDQLLELYGASPSVLDLILGNDLPVGCDMDLRGNTRLKLYPAFMIEDRANRAIRRRLEATLSPRALALMPQIARLNVSFDTDHSRVLHLGLMPHQVPSLLAELGVAGHPVVERATSLGLRAHVVAVPEPALGSRIPLPMNLYFIPHCAGHVEV